MKVRIIGSSSAVPRPGRACSSYLIEEAGTKLVLDLGTGALQSLMRFADPRKLDAILISHLHPDHFMDLVQLRYALTIPDPIDPPLPVHLPPEAEAQVARLAQSLPSSSGEAFFAGALALMEYDAENVLRIGACEIAFRCTAHYIDAYAMRVVCPSGTVVYSSDTAPCDAVTELARNADLFICESALGVAGMDHEPRGHSNAREAAAMARDAHVRHLVLTHYGSGAEPADLQDAAATLFGDA